MKRYGPEDTQPGSGCLLYLIAVLVFMACLWLFLEGVVKHDKLSLALGATFGMLSLLFMLLPRRNQ